MYSVADSICTRCVCKVRKAPGVRSPLPQRDNRQVVDPDLLVAGGHPAELLDLGKEALHLVHAASRPLGQRDPDAWGHDGSNPSLSQQLAVGAGEVSSISYELAWPTMRSAALAAAQLQTMALPLAALIGTALLRRD